MDWRLSELVAFLQDSNRQAFMDICTDGEKCSLKNCELNHHNIYYMLKYELDNGVQLKSRVSQVSESNLESYEGIVKQFESKKPSMEGEAEIETDDALSFTHGSPKRLSLDAELVDQKDDQFQNMKPVPRASKFISKEACCDKSNTPDSIFREGSEPNSKAEISSNEDGTRSLASLFASQNTEKLPDSEDSNLTVVSTSKQCHDNISIRSSSTNSTRSFAFPVLTTDWTGSPARMVEANKRDFKRRTCFWRMCF